MIGYLKRLVYFILFCLKSVFRKRHKETPILPTAFGNSKGGQSANKFKDDWEDWQPMEGVVVEENKKLADEVQQPEVDFFADMVPKFKKPTQIRIRSNNEPSSTHSRLNADVNFTLGATGLGDMDDGDGDAWGDDEVLDDGEIIALKNQALKDKRSAERERRRKEKERSSKLS